MIEIYTRKIYYKKYDHRLVIRCKSGRTTDRKAPTAEVISWLLDSRYDGQWRGMNTYSYIKGSTHYAVFFKDIKVMEYLKKHIDQKYFDTIEKPMDKEHSEMLTNSEILITRRQLFYNKYRIALRVEPTRISAWQQSTENIQKIQAWCKEQFGADSDRFHMQGWARGNFYFVDPGDALLFKLTWGGSGVRTERVITIAELEESRTPLTIV